MDNKTPEQDTSSMTTMVITQRLDQLLEVNNKILQASRSAAGSLEAIKVIIIIIFAFGAIAVLVSCAGLF